MPAARPKRRPKVGPGRLSAAETAELPNRLLDAAFALFNEHGYADATMDQIAKRAGASTKTLYSRFANKSEILEAVVRRNVQRTVADHLRAFALRPAESEPEEFLYRFGVQVCLGNLEEETTGMTRVTFAEAHRFPVLMHMYREVTNRGRSAIANALRLWRESGQISFDVDPEAAGALCFDMMTSEMRLRAVLNDPAPRDEIERYVRLAVQVFLSGIVTPPKAQARKRGRAGA